jgi:hypothetical protein
LPCAFAIAEGITVQTAYVAVRLALLAEDSLGHVRRAREDLELPRQIGPIHASNDSEPIWSCVSPGLDHTGHRPLVGRRTAVAACFVCGV